MIQYCDIIENIKHSSVVHEGEKTYECEICDDNFTQQSGLNVHMERIHENKRPKIECPICGAQLTKSDLAVHVCSIHKGRKLSKQHKSKINNLKSKMMRQFQLIKSEDGENIYPGPHLKGREEGRGQVTVTPHLSPPSINLLH